MYNEDFKNKFIMSVYASEQYKVNIVNLFKTFESLETSLKKDIYEMDAETITAFIHNTGGLRYKSTVSKLSSIKKYLVWCEENGIKTCANDLDNDPYQYNGSMKLLTVANPKQLDKRLNEIFDPVDENTIDNVFRAYIWLAYGGMPEEDILDISVNDVDFETMTVNHNGNSAVIYRESIDVFKMLINSDSFTYKHPLYSKDIIRNRVLGKELLRGVKAFPSILYIRSELSRKVNKCINNGKTSFKMSYSRAYLSGVFYRANECELAGYDVNFYNEAILFAHNKGYCERESESELLKRIKIIEKDYRRDYERWKQTFK